MFYLSNSSQDYSNFTEVSVEQRFHSRCLRSLVATVIIVNSQMPRWSSKWLVFLRKYFPKSKHLCCALLNCRT